MSINDVANYVRQTPGNTNPSVIKSMVQSEVNGTLKESKAYTDQEINNLKKSGGVGNAINNKVAVNLGDIDNADVTVMNIGFSYVSPMIPTKEEIAKWRISFENLHSDTGEKFQVELFVKNVMFDDDMVYGGTLGAVDFPGLNVSVAIAVAYQSGEWEAGGIVINKPGIYVSLINSAIDQETEVYLSFEWETIYQIDPKFLPGVCLPKVIDLTKYDAGGESLKDKVLNLFASGGGVASVTHTDGTKAFWRDVSADGNICVLFDVGPKLVANVNSKTFEASMELEAIEVSFLISPGGSTSRVTVLFGNFTEMEITVAVEPVTVG